MIFSLLLKLFSQLLLFLLVSNFSDNLSHVLHLGARRVQWSIALPSLPLVAAFFAIVACSTATNTVV